METAVIHRRRMVAEIAGRTPLREAPEAAATMAVADRTAAVVAVRMVEAAVGRTAVVAITDSGNFVLTTPGPVPEKLERALSVLSCQFSVVSKEREGRSVLG
jgi:hypothetical protein